MAQRLWGTTFHDMVRPPLGHGLTSVDVYVTSQCNRRCTYCFLPSEFFASGARMSLDAFSGVVTWCLRHGVGEITLLGGEPSLHPSFAEMVAIASGQGLEVRVVTNGARRFRRGFGIARTGGCLVIHGRASILDSWQRMPRSQHSATDSVIRAFELADTPSARRTIGVKRAGC